MAYGPPAKKPKTDNDEETKSRDQDRCSHGMEFLVTEKEYPLRCLRIDERKAQPLQVQAVISMGRAQARDSPHSLSCLRSRDSCEKSRPSTFPSRVVFREKNVFDFTAENSILMTSA